MKKVILSLSAAFIMSGLYAQRAEIETANAAFKANNYTVALSNAAIADEKLAEDRTIEPDDITAFYYNAGKAAKATGDMSLAAKYFAKLGELESSSYWKAKNKNNKNWEYFFDKNEAQKVISAGNYGKLKEGNFTKNYLGEIAPEINADANAALKTGEAAFQAQNYEQAGEEFLKAYYLYKAVGKDNKLLRYYAALALLQTEDKSSAAEMLQELIDDGFTGVTTNYYAIDKASGEKVAFSNKIDLDTQVKLGIVIKPEIETTESLEEDLYSNTTYAWYSLEDWDKALLVGQKGLEKFPSNTNMNQIVSGVYFKSGNIDQFITSLREKVDKGTATAEDYFNLAKSIEDTDGDTGEVQKYYKKAIEMNPNFAEAYLNLAFSIITPEKQYVEIMNSNLGSTAKEKKLHKENSEKRRLLYVEAVPYLENAYELKPDDLSLIKILRISYDVLGDDDKYIEFKKLYEEKSAL